MEQLMTGKKKVVVGMSGGVDSSVAAYLLKEQGYEVIGVTMQIWQDEEQAVLEDEGGCCGLSAVEDARRVAQLLDIPYYVMNFKDVFREKVICNFLSEYQKGRTPNPCIACNRYVKWEALLHRSLEIGADYIATGHYARIRRLENGRLAVASSAAVGKDQTYALYQLTQEQLAHTLMPVGDYTKEEIRAIAARIGLPVAKKRDSQEICFVPDQDYAGFIEAHMDTPPVAGNFVDFQGNILGRHRGIIHYTIGQRKGLGIAFGHPVFVAQIRPETNEVVLGTGEEVFSRKLYANRIQYMGASAFDGETPVMAKIRYSHQGAGCRVKMLGEDLLECSFEEKQRAVTPGQAVVFYRDGVVLGGGTILGDERSMGKEG